MATSVMLLQPFSISEEGLMTASSATEAATSVVKATIHKLVQLILQARVNTSSLQISSVNNDWLNLSLPHVQKFHDDTEHVWQRHRPTITRSVPLALHVYIFAESTQFMSDRKQILLESYKISWDARPRPDDECASTLLCQDMVMLVREIASFIRQVPPHQVALLLRMRPSEFEITYELAFSDRHHTFADGRGSSCACIHHSFLPITTKEGELSVRLNFRKKVRAAWTKPLDNYVLEKSYNPNKSIVEQEKRGDPSAEKQGADMSPPIRKDDVQRTKSDHDSQERLGIVDSISEPRGNPISGKNTSAEDLEYVAFQQSPAMEFIEDLFAMPDELSFRQQTADLDELQKYYEENMEMKALKNRVLNG